MNTSRRSFISGAVSLGLAGSAKAKAKGPLVCRFDAADFEGPVKFTVRVCNSFGVSRGELTAELDDKKVG